MTTHSARRAAADTGPANGAAGPAVWLVYGLIVLEILFMVSPFAAYYYAVYAVPLNGLAQTPGLTWLVLHVLPHFSHSSSTLVVVLLSLAWPLIVVGLVLFAVGFGQIYLAKLRGGGPVEAGLYRHVRHPQYLALALVGLGTTLFWSRFLVIIAYVSMLCMYLLLARLEERRCLARFGSAYQAYLDRTGAFLPRRAEQWLGGFLPRLPAAGWQRAAVAMASAGALLTGTVAGAWQLRAHALANLQVTPVDGHAVVFLAPAEPDLQRRVADLLRDRLPATGRRVVYVAPQTWSVPELGLEAHAGGTASGYDRGAARELLRPTSHGNAGVLTATGIHALVTAPDLFRPAEDDGGLLAATWQIRPQQLWLVDAAAGSLTPRPAATRGWPGIPVPVF